MKKNNKLYIINKKSLNFNVNSSAYNLVEFLHHIILLNTANLIIGGENYVLSL